MEFMIKILELSSGHWGDGMIKILELSGGTGATRAALRNLAIPVKSIDYVEIDEKPQDSNRSDQIVNTRRRWQPRRLVSAAKCGPISKLAERRRDRPSTAWFMRLSELI